MSIDLKKKRKELGLSQVELAKMVGVSMVTIQMWERGVSEPKPENQEKLLRALEEYEKKKRLQNQGVMRNETENQG